MIVGRLDCITRIMLPGILLLSLTKVLPWIPSIPDVVYYGSFWGVFIWFVLRGGAKIQYTYLPFLITIFLSIGVNDIPAFFKVWFRVLAFISVIVAIGPFCVNPAMLVWRRLLFIYSLTAIRWIVIASFVAWACGWSYVYGYSGFSGFTYQSMILGPLGGISLLYSLYRFYVSTKYFGRYEEIAFIVISTIVLLLAASRSALGATLLAVTFFYSRVYRHQITKLGKIGFTVLFVAVLTSAIWWPYTERLRSKMDGGKKSGSLTNTRDNLWEDRLEEFNAFPVFGVGFATVNLDYIQTENKVNQTSGTIEPGSGWLFLLSSMGLVGFISFFVPFVHLIYFFFRRESVGLNGYFLGSLLFLFLFHLFFEGYLIASGAYLCFFLWLLLSECYRTINIDK